MNLAAGSRLGPYEILARLGAGGMGEVWRARDTRLDRSVAVKVLPSEFSADAHLKARFDREAKAISHLSHPHICSLFDVGHDGGVDFLVMELIDGQTLADRLARGPLPLDQLIRYGIEIAEALEHAHRSGITHRDLKPQNIMITKSGAKLLDFGLAQRGLVNLESPEGATARRPLTQEGTIVGTFQYMSPEQIEGGVTDSRSDIFALGAVLYEMATGKRAFDGKTKTSVIAAIVSSEPTPISRLQPLTPRALEHLIQGCLAKERDARVQSAHDVALQLRWIADTSESRPRHAKSWLAWAAAAALAVMLAAGVVYHMRTRTSAQPVRFTVAAPPDTAIDGVPAVSPDGSQLVFRTVAADGSSMLWIRSIDSVDARPLKGTEGADFAFWSPDGRNVGFMARGKLSRLDLANGSVRTIYEPIDYPPGGASWNRDDVIVFNPRVEGTLLRVPASGGAAVPVATSVKHDSAIWPWFLPDGDHFLYSCQTHGEDAIYVGSIVSGKSKWIAKGGWRPAYADGRAFFVRAGSLYAQQFDVRNLELRGELVKIDDGVQHVSPGRASFSVSDGGTIAYRKSGAAVVSQLSFADRNGRTIGTIAEPAPISNFDLSPDERRIVYMRWEDQPTIWMLDIARGTSTEVVFAWSGWPLFLSDSRSIVYGAPKKTPPNLFVRRADGASERLFLSDQQNYPTSVSSDGRYAIYEFNSPQTSFDLYAISIAEPHKLFPVVTSPFVETDGMISPDSRWLAFTSNESGGSQVYAVAFPGGGGKVQISNSGGIRARWSRNGRELFYIEPGSKRMMAVKIAVADGELRPSVPLPLFPIKTETYGVTRDGRFLVAEDRVNAAAPGLTVVVNWRDAQR